MIYCFSSYICVSQHRLRGNWALLRFGCHKTVQMKKKLLWLMVYRQWYVRSSCLKYVSYPLLDFIISVNSYIRNYCNFFFFLVCLYQSICHERNYLFIVEFVFYMWELSRCSNIDRLICTLILWHGEGWHVERLSKPELCDRTLCIHFVNVFLTFVHEIFNRSYQELSHMVPQNSTWYE